MCDLKTEEMDLSSNMLSPSRDLVGPRKVLLHPNAVDCILVSLNSLSRCSKSSSQRHFDGNRRLARYGTRST